MVPEQRLVGPEEVIDPRPVLAQLRPRPVVCTTAGADVPRDRQVLRPLRSGTARKGRRCGDARAASLTGCGCGSPREGRGCPTWAVERHALDEPGPRRCFVQLDEVDVDATTEQRRRLALLDPDRYEEPLPPARIVAQPHAVLELTELRVRVAR